jgi:hypothetical protein
VRYIVLLKATQPAGPPPAALMEGIMKLATEAEAAGALVDTAGLQPSATGARVQVTGGQLTALDGPFTESKEYISYALYDVRSKEEAVEWTARFLRLHADLWAGWEGEADIRGLFGPEDFAPQA